VTSKITKRIFKTIYIPQDNNDKRHIGKDYCCTKFHNICHLSNYDINFEYNAMQFMYLQLT